MKTAKTIEQAQRWLSSYFDLYRQTIFQEQIHDQLIELGELLSSTSQRGRKVIFAGNGGSSAMASHCAVDFTKLARIRSINFNEVDLITCFSNDYGYENWVQKGLEFYGDPGDVVVLISSSGKSPNMVNAARYADAARIGVVTFTGFAEDNPLRMAGHHNFWVNSQAYNIIEMTHHIWLLAVCDLIVGKAEHSAH